MKTHAKPAEEAEVYRSLGEEIGRLLQRAKDIADGIKAQAEKDADAVAADAQRALVEAREEAKRILESASTASAGTGVPKKTFSKSALSAALSSFGIDYRHERALGSPKQIRHQLREDGNFQRYFRDFREYLASQRALLDTLARDLDHLLDHSLVVHTAAATGDIAHALTRGDCGGSRSEHEAAGGERVDDLVFQLFVFLAVVETEQKLDRFVAAASSDAAVTP